MAPTGGPGPRRSKPVGDELKRRMAVIIEAAPQPRRALPRNPRGVESRRHPGEEVGRLVGQEFVDGRRAVDHWPVLVRLAVEDAQRIAFKPRLAVLAERGGVGAEMREQRITPGAARFRIAEGVKLEDRAADPK